MSDVEQLRAVIAKVDPAVLTAEDRGALLGLFEASLTAVTAGGGRCSRPA